MRKLRVALVSLVVLGPVLAIGARQGAAEVEAGLAVGGGQRGARSYASVEARLDAALGKEGGSWGLGLGLAARGQWDDGQWRRDDFTTARGWAAVVRYLEWWRRGSAGELAIAAGALRPAAMAHVSDGAQTGIDDRHHSGLRVRGRAGKLELGGELDDGFAPRLLALEVGWRTDGWRAAAATAVGFSPWGADAGEQVLAMPAAGEADAGAGDPSAPALDPEAAVELSLARRFLAGGVDDDGDGMADEARLGLGVVAEPGAGAHALAFAELWADSETWRVVLRADVRLGTGSLGALFGPLYRLERLERLRGQALDGEPRDPMAPTDPIDPIEPTDPIDPADPGDPGAAPAMNLSPRGAGFAAGLSLRLEHGGGWFEGSLRTRRHGGAIATAHLGLPLTARAQAGAWLAADADHLALASELRAFGRANTFAAVEVSRLLRTRDPRAAELELGWAVVGWVGISR